MLVHGYQKKEREIKVDLRRPGEVPFKKISKKRGSAGMV